MLYVTDTPKDVHRHTHLERGGEAGKNSASAWHDLRKRSKKRAWTFRSLSDSGGLQPRSGPVQVLTGNMTMTSLPCRISVYQEQGRPRSA